MRASSDDRERHPAGRPGQRGLERHAGEGARPARVVVGVHEDDVDDDQEPQRRHRHVVPGEAHQRRADEQRQDHAHQPGDDRGRQEGQAPVGEPGRQVGQEGGLRGDRQGEDAGGVGADGDEADMAEREHAGEAVAQAHRGDEDRVDADHDQDRGRCSRRATCGSSQPRSAKRPRRPPRSQVKEGRPHSFTSWVRASGRSGRNRRKAIRRAKTTASR